MMATGTGKVHRTDLPLGITGPMGTTRDSYPTEPDSEVAAIWMGGERKRSAGRRRRLNIVRCEQGR